MITMLTDCVGQEHEQDLTRMAGFCSIKSETLAGKTGLAEASGPTSEMAASLTHRAPCGRGA
jgi:hypothetical protein